MSRPVAATTVAPTNSYGEPRTLRPPGRTRGSFASRFARPSAGVVERKVEDAVVESVRLRRTLRGLGVFADVIVISVREADEWRDVRGSLIPVGSIGFLGGAPPAWTHLGHSRERLAVSVSTCDARPKGPLRSADGTDQTAVGLPLGGSRSGCRAAGMRRQKLVAHRHTSKVRNPSSLLSCHGPLIAFADERASAASERLRCMIWKVQITRRAVTEMFRREEAMRVPT